MDNDQDKDKDNDQNPHEELNRILEISIKADRARNIPNVAILCLTFLVAGILLGSFLERQVTVKCNPQTQPTEKGNSNASNYRYQYPRF